MKRFFAVALCAIVTISLCSDANANDHLRRHHSESVALWRLNEGRNASTAIDSSKYQHEGRVGGSIRTGVQFKDGTGYHFPVVARSAPDQLKHIVTVDESRKLDPDRANFVVSLRFRTQNRNGNLIQKGQSGMAGGLWKLEFNRGVLACMFRDRRNRQDTATSLRPINNGKWHTVTCKRTSRSVIMLVDGKRRSVHRKRTGSVNNDAPLSIGGKRYCGGPVQCDYWWGDLDWVKIKKG